MQHPIPARRQAPPTGVIETLSAGFAAINRHLWVLLLPVLVDVFLWFGPPHVSYSPLVDPGVTRASEWARQIAVGPRRAQRNPEYVSLVDDSRAWLIARTSEVNVLSLVARGPVAPPSLGSVPNARGDMTFVSDWPAGIGLLVACLMASLVLGGGFYRGLAAASFGRGARPPFGAGRIARDVVRVVGLIGALLGIGLLLGVPVLLLVAFTAFVAPLVASLGILLMLGALLWVVLHLFFAVDAIFVSNVGPLSAIQRSVGVVRRHLWPSVALMLLTWLILAGMTQVWGLLASNLQPPYGIALSIVGNAYIASGLIAAGMIFYIERSDALPNPGPASALSAG